MSSVDNKLVKFKQQYVADNCKHSWMDLGIENSFSCMGQKLRIETVEIFDSHFTLGDGICVFFILIFFFGLAD